jgi:multidrug efflux system outer membrane protein
VPGAWLKSFLDPQLDAIVAEAQAHNIDLRFAAARVEIAQQQVIVAGAALQPQVGAQLGARSVYDKDAGQAFNGTQAFVGVAWELDRLGAGCVRSAMRLATWLRHRRWTEVWARESLAALVAKAWFLGVQTRQLMALSEQAVAVVRQAARTGTGAAQGRS